MIQKKTVFYLDPPYTRDVRSDNIYAYEMETEEHKKLMEKLSNIEGKFILSGYNNELYDELLKDYRKREIVVKSSLKVKENVERTEVLWFNYPEYEEHGFLNQIRYGGTAIIDDVI